MYNKKEKFIEKSNKKHDNKYDYSKVEYVNSKTKVCIVCPEHGEFWQTPAAHVRGNGCPECANKKRGKRTVNTENLIEKYQSIHNSKYTYEKTQYIDANTKICVTCPEHGDFYILPFNHVNYPHLKEGASWADSLSRIISPQALISAVPAVLFLQNANRLMLFAASKSL